MPSMQPSTQRVRAQASPSMSSSSRVQPPFGSLLGPSFRGRAVKFDLTINLGQVLAFGGIAVALITGFTTAKSDIANQKKVLELHAQSIETLRKSVQILDGLVAVEKALRDEAEKRLSRLESRVYGQ